MDHKAINALFHTNLRNIGLFTSISLAILGASRFYRGKGMIMYNVGYILISLVFTVMSLMMANYLMEDHEKLIKKMKKEDTELLDKWYMLPKMLLVTNSVILVFSLYTLMRQFM
jgi:predicted Co/Zn/Cd cation transporter (cation efflux family)